MHFSRRRRVESATAPGEQAHERLLAGDELRPHRIGELRPPAVEAAGAAGRFRDLDLGEFARGRDREWPQSHRLEQLEDRGVRADAEGERQQRRGRERLLSGEDADGVADVLPQAVSRTDRVHGVDLFPNAGRVAELPDGGVARVLRRHAARHVVVGFDRQVPLDLAGTVGVAPRSVEKAQPAHGADQSVAGLRMRPTARTSCSQRVVSAASWRRPAGVSRQYFARRLFSEVPQNDLMRPCPRDGKARGRASRVRPGGRDRSRVQSRVRGCGRARVRARASEGSTGPASWSMSPWAGLARRGIAAHCTRLDF